MQTQKRTNSKLEKAKNVPISEVLAKLNIPYQKGKRIHIHEEGEDKRAACFIDEKNNIFFDHRNGYQGSNLDLVIEKRGLTGADKLFRAADFILAKNDYQYQNKANRYKYLIKKASEIPTPAEREANEPKEAPKYKILSVGGVTKTASFCYISARKINDKVRKLYLCGIEYLVNEKKYFGVGMVNKSGGFEISSAFTQKNQEGKYTYHKTYKIHLGKVDITLVKRIGQNHNKYLIFEGQWDFLAYETMLLSKGIEGKRHVIILNTWANYKKVIDYLKDLEDLSIFYFGDNDLPNSERPNEIPRGDFVLQELQKEFANSVVDFRPRYAEYSDLNDKLMGKKLSTPKTFF